MTDIEDLMTVEEAAIHIGMAPHSVYHHIYKSKRLIPVHIRDNRLIFLKKTNVAEFVKNHVPNRGATIVAQATQYTIGDGCVALGNVSRARFYKLAKMHGWKVGRGLYGKAEIDAFQSKRLAKRDKK